MNREYPTVNFIGNKEKIVDWLFDFVPDDVNIFLMDFLEELLYLTKQKRNLQVISNDALKINYLISKSLVENKKYTLSNKDVEIIFEGKPFSGYMHKNYSNYRFYPKECMELDLYRANIEKLSNNYKKLWLYL